MEVLLTAVRSGARLAVAAEFAGIAAATVEEWMRRAEGRDDRPPQPEHIAFAEAVTQAKAHAHMYALSQVRAQMPRDWGAAKFWLQTTYPEMYRTDLPPALPTGPTTLVGQQQNNVIVIAADEAERLGLAALAQKRLSSPESSDGDGPRSLDDLIVEGDDPAAADPTA